MPAVLMCIMNNDPPARIPCWKFPDEKHEVLIAKSQLVENRNHLVNKHRCKLCDFVWLDQSSARQ